MGVLWRDEIERKYEIDGATIEGARDRGLDIDCDSYPYTAGSNPLKSLLPR